MAIVPWFRQGFFSFPSGPGRYLLPPCVFCSLIDFLIGFCSQPSTPELVRLVSSKHASIQSRAMRQEKPVLPGADLAPAERLGLLVVVPRFLQSYS